MWGGDCKVCTFQAEITFKPLETRTFWLVALHTFKHFCFIFTDLSYLIFIFHFILKHYFAMLIPIISHNSCRTLRFIASFFLRLLTGNRVSQVNNLHLVKVLYVYVCTCKQSYIHIHLGKDKHCCFFCIFCFCWDLPRRSLNVVEDMIGFMLQIPLFFIVQHSCHHLLLLSLKDSHENHPRRNL